MCRWRGAENRITFPIVTAQPIVSEIYGFRKPMKKDILQSGLQLSKNLVDGLAILEVNARIWLLGLPSGMALKLGGTNVLQVST